MGGVIINSGVRIGEDKSSIGERLDWGGEQWGEGGRETSILVQ